MKRLNNLSYFYQVLFTLISLFLVVIIVSALLALFYHNASSRYRFESYCKSISSGLSYNYMQAISENELGKIISQNTDLIDINDQILYISVNLKNYDQLLFSEREGKWTELAKPKNQDIDKIKAEGQFLDKEDSAYAFGVDVYQYRFPIEQLEARYGYFEIGVDLTEDETRFNQILFMIIAYEVSILLILVFVSYFFARAFSKPILNLHESVKKISEGEFDVKLIVHGGSEIADLAVSFNEMAQRISHMNQELESKVNLRTIELQDTIVKLNEAQDAAKEAAMQAGMAEIATNVLHNVGNVLNSVNVSAGFVKEQVQSSSALHIQKISDLLNSNLNNLPQFFEEGQKGTLIPSYISELSKCINQEFNKLTEEIDRLMKKIDSIKEIVSLQQDYASKSDMKQKLKLQELVLDCFLITGLSEGSSVIKLNSNIEISEAISIDRHKLLQILVNLMKNAKDSFNNIERDNKTIKITAKLIEDNVLSISIQDNGCGIDADAKKRIFEHGFTTKQNGHGFGLHSCAIYARNMGGELFFESEGLNMGTTFTLLIPLDMV